MTKKKSREQLQAEILITQQQILRHNESRLLPFLTKAISSTILSSALIYWLFLMRKGPYFKQFSAWVIQYTKENNPSIGSLFEKLIMLQKIDKDKKLALYAKELDVFLNDIEKIGIKLKSQCKQVIKSSIKGNTETVIMNGVGDIAINTATNFKFMKTQACNGGLTGIGKKINKHVLLYTKTYAEYFTRPGALASFAGIGLFNSIATQYGREACQTIYKKVFGVHRPIVSSTQLMSHSHNQLQALHLDVIDQEAALRLSNDKDNRLLLIIFFIAVTCMLAYGKEVHPMVISILTTMGFPVSNHLFKFFRNRSIASRTEKQLTDIIAIFNAQATNCNVNFRAGPTLTESVLEISTKNDGNKRALQALIYCLRRRDFICESVKRMTYVYLTGDLDIFNESSPAQKDFWETYQKTMTQFVALSEATDLLLRAEHDFTFRAHPVSGLPSILLFFRKSEHQLTAYLDLNAAFRVIPIEDDYANGYEVIINGRLSALEMNQLKQLVNKKTVAANPLTTAVLTAGQAPAADAKPLQTLPTTNTNLRPGLFSAAACTHTVKPSKKQKPDAIGADNGPKSKTPPIIWPSGLVYDHANPENTTPGLAPLHWQGRDYSIFVYNPNLNQVSDEQLKRKLTNYFTYARAVPPIGHQGFVFEGGIPKLKLLGENNDTRLHATRLETNPEGRTVYVYENVTLDAHKMYHRKQVPLLK